MTELERQTLGDKDSRLEANRLQLGVEPQASTILSIVKDRANLITLLGLSAGVLAIVCAGSQNYPMAIVAMLWASLLDWYDGLVARKTEGRSEFHRSVGGRLDSLVDLISLAVVPATLLLSVGEFGAWFYPGALIIIMAGVLRLAHFDVFGVDENGTINGVSLDFSPYAIAAVFLCEGFLGHNVFVFVLYTTIVVFSLLHVAPIHTTKLTGVWYYIVTAYVAVMTVVYFLIGSFQ
jgi:CDP-diacylglycerol--serine O-phosphatidyltransferase